MCCRRLSYDMTRLYVQQCPMRLTFIGVFAQSQPYGLSVMAICKFSHFWPRRGYSNVVLLSLLTMTNPNQLCDVLLCVCSKMADETNLSSKLSVADRTREV